MLIITKDNSLEYKFSNSKLKIDLFGYTQAKEYFEKSLKGSIKNKESVIKSVLEPEIHNCFYLLQSLFMSC